MADAPISEELTVLRKRARRRLVGAVALVFMALIALWTVMDDRPPQSLLNQPVDIVSSSPGLSSTVPAAPKPQAQPEPTPPASEPASVSTAPLPTPQPQAQPEPVPLPNTPVVVAEPAPEKPQTTKSEPQRPAEKPVERPTKPVADPARILAGMDEAPADKPKPTAKTVSKPEAATGERYFVQLGAFADKDKAAGLVSKAKQAGVSIQTESVSTDKGTLTRLRAGPFANRDAADEVRTKLAGAGVTSTVVGK